MSYRSDELLYMKQNWTQDSIHILSTKMGDIDDVEIKILKDALTLNLDTQQYAARCLQELQNRLISYVQLKSNPYQLSNGLQGIQVLCQWQPLDNEILMQVHGFVVYKREGFRLFSSLAEAQWRLYGDYIFQYMREIDPLAIYSVSY